MSEAIPQIDGSFVRAEGTTGASSSDKTITSSGSANTKGSYVQITAVTTEDSYGIILVVRSDQSAGEIFLADIAIGAAASEQDIVSNLLINANTDYQTVYIPIFTQNNSRISMRHQSASSSAVLQASIIFPFGGMNKHASFDFIEAHGEDTTNTRGVDISPAVSLNQKSAWVEVESSLTHDAKAVIVATGDRGAGGLAHWFDLGIGAAASEQVKIENIYVVPEEQSAFTGPFYLDIPSGSRIAMRSQHDTSTTPHVLACCRFMVTNRSCPLPVVSHWCRTTILSPLRK